MSQPAPISPDLERQLPADDIVLLRDVTWDDYQRVLGMRGERPVPRLTYLEGVPELTTPSRPHEAIKSMIGRLVEAYVTIDRSALLPGLDLALLQRFIDVKPMTRAVTEYPAALRESR